MVNALQPWHIFLVIIQHYQKRAVLNILMAIVFMIPCFVGIMITENTLVINLIRDHVYYSLVLKAACMTLTRISVYPSPKKQQINLWSLIVNKLNRFTLLRQIKRNNNTTQLPNCHKAYKTYLVGGFRMNNLVLVNKKYVHLLMVSASIL